MSQSQPQPPAAQAPPQKPRDPTAAIDPDREWIVGSNKQYDHLKWYSTPDGAWERRYGANSAMDSFSGINFNKLPIRHGEFYEISNVPLTSIEYDEEAFWRNFKPTKTDEQLLTEMNRPRDALEAKMKEFEGRGEQVVWTRALSLMTTPTKPARKLAWEISPYFQLNKDGYRKNWANVRICEMRPLARCNTNLYWWITDYFIRFQQSRWNNTSRIRMRFFKAAMWFTAIFCTIDHAYMRKFRQKWKWH
jgi:hypothetical protein